MATESEIFPNSSDTVALWLFNGANIAAAGNDETGDTNLDLEVASGSPTYGVDGYGTTKSDSNDDCISMGNGMEIRTSAYSSKYDQGGIIIELLHQVHSYSVDASQSWFMSCYNSGRGGWLFGYQNSGGGIMNFQSFYSGSSSPEQLSFSTGSGWLNTWIFTQCAIESGVSGWIKMYGGRLGTETTPTKAASSNSRTYDPNGTDRLSFNNLVEYGRQGDGYYNTARILKPTSMPSSDTYYNERYTAVANWSVSAGLVGLERKPVRGAGRGIIRP